MTTPIILDNSVGAQTDPGLLLAVDGIQAPSIQVQQVPGIVFGLAVGSPLKTGSRHTSLAVSGGGGNEFHHVQSNVFVAPGAEKSCKWVHRVPPRVHQMQIL